MGTLKRFVRVTRAPFFTATIVPVTLGGAVAWHEGPFHWGYFLLTLLGAVCIHAGLDMSNDYFDHRSGLDARNQELTPFSGGSRVIQEGVLSARQVLTWSLSFYAVGIAVGLYLAAVRGPWILGVGVLGVFLAFFHNAPPFRLYYLLPGVGELAVGIGFGPLMVLGTVYVQLQRFTLGALWASIPVGLLIAAVLYINQFPDYPSDKAQGKRTLAVALGRARAAQGYVALLIATYCVVVTGIALSILPYPTALAILTVPLAYRATRGALRFHSDTAQLIPTLAATIQIHLATGLLLSAGYVVSKILLR